MYFFDEEDMLVEAGGPPRKTGWPALDEAAQRAYEERSSRRSPIEDVEVGDMDEILNSEDDDLDAIPFGGGSASMQAMKGDAVLSIIESACDMLRDAASSIATTHGHLHNLRDAVDYAIHLLMRSAEEDAARLSEMLNALSPGGRAESEEEDAT